MTSALMIYCKLRSKDERGEVMKYELMGCMCGRMPQVVVGYDTIQVECQCGETSKIIVGDYYDEGFMHTYEDEVILDWNREIINQIKGLWVCPVCSFIHPHWVQVREGFSKFCPFCGTKLSQEMVK